MRAINPHGPQVPNISQAMLVQNSDLLFLSGHVPMEPRGIVGTVIESQLEQIFKNMAATLSESGTTFSGVARLTIYVKNDNQDMFLTIRTVRDQFADVESPPASALIGVDTLAFPEILIEVDAIA